MAYTVHQAKTHFSRLLKEVEAGQEVIVMRGSKPVAKLVPIEPAVPKRRIAGGFEYLTTSDPSVFFRVIEAVLNHLFVGERGEDTVVELDEVLESADSAEMRSCNGLDERDDFGDGFAAAHDDDLLAGFGFFKQAGEVRLCLMNGVGHGLSMVSPL